MKDTANNEIEQEIETTESDDEHEDKDDSEPEPEEDSITTEDNLKFYQYGKLVFELTEDEDRNIGIKRELDRMRFWPNVFAISDHGNSCLIEYWKA